MNEWYLIEVEVSYQSKKFRAVSLFNSWKSPWMNSEDEAKELGDKHSVLIQRYFNAVSN